MVTLDEARAQLARLRPRIAEFLVLRADLAELRVDLAEHGSSPHGALADAKGMEARLYAELEALSNAGWQVKSYAPLLLDLPGERYGVAVLWCWVEGEPDIGWYHRFDTGFAGRRPS